MKWYNPETVWWLLDKFHTEVPYDPEIPLLGRYPKELKTGPPKKCRYTHVRSGILHNSQMAETTQVSIVSGQIDFLELGVFHKMKSYSAMKKNAIRTLPQH